MAAMVENAVTLEREQLSLKINEIFYSIQGEGSYALYPCVFVRLTGCNLRCVWCDTTYSFFEGAPQTLAEIFAEVSRHNSELVEVTGGEPLLQKNVYAFFEMLQAAGKKVLIETSGSILIDRVPDYVHIVLDLKAPDSGESEKNKYENLDYIKPSDDIKIVVASKKDFEFAENIVTKYVLSAKMEKPVIVQPAFGQLESAEVGEWIKNSATRFRLGLQLHKFIYEPTLRAV
jgi:7-carboxy-7-deazaguanine synthase